MKKKRKKRRFGCSEAVSWQGGDVPQPSHSWEKMRKGVKLEFTKIDRSDHRELELHENMDCYAAIVSAFLCNFEYYSVLSGAGKGV